MMKIQPFFTLNLVLFLLASACAPAVTESVQQPSVTVAVEASLTPVVDVPSATLEGQPLADSTATPPVDAQPVATSRGPDLHATDPTTVSLAAGQLHFVEFFRFT